jgi:hypothetical protein
MNITHLALPLTLATAASLHAQNDVLFYKFEGGGTKAVNYAVGSPAPGEGPILNTLTTAPVESYVAGRFGDALNSGIAVAPVQANYVVTNWSPSVTGDYTWSIWLRNTRLNPAPSLTYVVGIPTGGSFRLFTGGGALFTTGNAGGTTSYATVANVYQLATAGWLHLAFVVDTTAMTATYYVNGVAEPPRVLTGMPNITGTQFNIGRQLTTAAPSIYDIDEFRFLTRAVSAAEIQSWAAQNAAGAGAFGAGCSASLAPLNGPPVLGNVGFGFQGASSAPTSLGVLALGVSRTQWGALPLPFDLGLALPPLAGCQLECSADVTLTVITDAAGAFQQPFPIPPGAIYDGFQLYAQGLLLGGPNGLSSTNPVAVVVGN